MRPVQNEVATSVNKLKDRIGDLEDKIEKVESALGCIEDHVVTISNNIDRIIENLKVPHDKEVPLRKYVIYYFSKFLSGYRHNEPLWVPHLKDAWTFEDKEQANKELKALMDMDDEQHAPCIIIPVYISEDGIALDLEDTDESE